jgi:uncharacterized membrane protein YbhN (UPF0104 family)
MIGLAGTILVTTVIVFSLLTLPLRTVAARYGCHLCKSRRSPLGQHCCDLRYHLFSFWILAVFGFAAAGYLEKTGVGSPKDFPVERTVAPHP